LTQEELAYWVVPIAMVVADVSDGVVDGLTDEVHIPKPMSRWSCCSLSRTLHYYAVYHSNSIQILSVQQAKGPQGCGFPIAADGHMAVAESCAVRVSVAL
jgi:hypothetical protein